MENIPTKKKNKVYFNTSSQSKKYFKQFVNKIFQKFI